MELGILLATTHAIVTLKRRIRAPNKTDAMNIKAAIPCPLLSSLFCSRVLPWLIDDIDVSGFLVEFRSVNNMYQLIVSYSFITHNHKSMLFWWLLSQIYQLIWAAVMSSMHFWLKIYILTDWMKKNDRAVPRGYGLEYVSVAMDLERWRTGRCFGKKSYRRHNIIAR